MFGKPGCTNPVWPWVTSLTRRTSTWRPFSQSGPATRRWPDEFCQPQHCPWIEAQFRQLDIHQPTGWQSCAQSIGNHSSDSNYEKSIRESGAGFARHRGPWRGYSIAGSRRWPRPSLNRVACRYQNRIGKQPLAVLWLDRPLTANRRRRARYSRTVLRCCLFYRMTSGTSVVGTNWMLCTIVGIIALQEVRTTNTRNSSVNSKLAED